MARISIFLCPTKVGPYVGIPPFRQTLLTYKTIEKKRTTRLTTPKLIYNTGNAFFELIIVQIISNLYLLDMSYRSIPVLFVSHAQFFDQSLRYEVKSRK